MTINGGWDSKCAADLFAQRDPDEIFRLGKARNMQMLGGTCLKENRFGIAVDDSFVARQDVCANNAVGILAVQA